MRLIMLGSPGAGKGTQAVNLAKIYKVPHISTGDIFRYNIRNGTELGIKAKGFIDNGMLVPDDLTQEIVKDRILMFDCKEGFILDGFPRTIVQAEFLGNFLAGINIVLNHVINLTITDEEVLKRISARRICVKCGANFNEIYSPSKINKICDFCGTKLILREDDKEAIVLKRLEHYYELTHPLIDYYTEKGLIINVPSMHSIDETTVTVEKMLGVNE